MNEQNPARQFLDMVVPTAALKKYREEYGIEAEEGSTFKDVIFKLALKKSREGDKDFMELVKEYNIHE